MFVQDSRPEETRQHHHLNFRNSIFFNLSSFLDTRRSFEIETTIFDSLLCFSLAQMLRLILY